MGKFKLCPGHIAVAFGIKLMLATLVLFLFNRGNSLSDFRTFQDNDTTGYLQPVENFLQKGFWAVSADDPRTCAVRPPALGLIYLPIRFALGPTLAPWGMVLFQILLSSIAVVAFAILTEHLTQSWRWASIAFLFSAFNPPLLFYDLRLITESLAASLSLFVLLLIFRDKFRRLYATFISGILLAVIIFLRPFLAVALPVLAALILRAKIKRPLLAAKHLAAISLPFVVSCLAWTWWCYPRLEGRLIFLQSSFPKAYTSRLPYFPFVSVWGGEKAPWVDGSPGAWFEGQAGFQFPSIVFTDVPYTLEDLTQARDEYLHAKQTHDEEAMDSVAARLGSYAVQFARSHPFYSHTIAPIKILRRFIATLHTDGVESANFYKRSRIFRIGFNAFAFTATLFYFLGFLFPFLSHSRAARSSMACFSGVTAINLINIAINVTVFTTTEGRIGLIPMWLLYPWSFLVLSSFFKPHPAPPKPDA